MAATGSGLDIKVTADSSDATSDLNKLGAEIQRVAQKAGVAFDTIGHEAAQSMVQATNAVDNFAHEAQQSFDEAAAAARKYEAQVTAVGKGNDRAMRAASGASANIAAQFNDIAVQAQSGTSWMTVALQQGTQLSQVFAGMGKEGTSAWKSIGSAILSVLNPTSLLTIGLVGLGTVGIQALMSMIPAAKSVEDVMKEHEARLKRIKELWPEVGDALKDVTTKFAQAMAEFEARNELKASLKEYQDAIKKIGEQSFGADKYKELQRLANQSLAYTGEKWKDVFADIASGKRTIDDIIVGFNKASEASSAMFVTGTARKTAAYLNTLQDLTNYGFKPLNSVMDKFYAGLLAGEPNITGTINKLQDLLDTAKTDAEREEILGVMKQFEGIEELARSVERAERILKLAKGDINALATAKEFQDRVNKTAVKGQEDYNASIQDMRDLAKEANPENLKLIENARHRAIITARTTDQQRYANKLADESLISVNKQIALERNRTAALEAETNAQKQYNSAMQGMLNLVPKLQLSTEQQIRLQERLAQASGADKGDRDAAAARAQQTLQQLANADAYNTLANSIKSVEQTLPTMNLSLQDQAAAWLAAANAGETNQSVLEQNQMLYDDLTGKITSFNEAFGLMGELQQMAAGSFDIIKSTLADYSSKIAAGAATTADLRQALVDLREAIPNDMFRDQIDALIEHIDKSQQDADAQNALTTALNTVGGAGSGAAGGLYAAGDAAETSGNQAAGAVGQVMALAKAWLAFNQSRTGFGPVTADSVKNVKTINADLATARDLAKQYYASGDWGKGWEVEQQGLKQYTNDLTNTMHFQDVAFREQERMDKLNAELKAEAEAARKAKGGGGKKKGGGGAGDVEGLDMSADQLKNWADNMLFAIDPTIKLAEEQRNLAAAVKLGYVTQDQAILINKKLEEQYGKTADATFDLGKKMGEVFDQWGQQVASSLADAIVNGEDLNQVFQDLIKTLLKMILQMVVLEPLMKSITSGFGAGGFNLFGGGAAASAPAVSAANYNGLSRSLPAPGMLGGRSAMVSGSGGSGTVMSTVGGITINFGTGGKEVAGDSHKAQLLGQRMRDVIQTEMVRQSRPGGLLWGGGR